MIKRYYIGNIHRNARYPGQIYACLFDSDDQIVISATLDYILDAARDRYSGQVQGVIKDYDGKPAQQTKV